ncbi:uncharacterized protein LOC119671441 [Teleopsis dalmanni]|uniref:uncharacterized protein LOC119671441 n=1 Tax=Teleopsis dalmanni TaxID=139649 RepID=UPI0018CE33B7|nr:uncharacterized protein LOC119671441 [Teleopsis dalmanni]
MSAKDAKGCKKEPPKKEPPKKDPCKPQPKKPKLPKPVMRGLHMAQTMRNIYTAVALSATAGICFYFLYRRPHRAVFREFYENYDTEKAFNRMMAAGIFDGAPPEGAEKKKKK